MTNIRLNKIDDRQSPTHLERPMFDRMIDVSNHEPSYPNRRSDLYRVRGDSPVDNLRNTILPTSRICQGNGEDGPLQ